MIAATAAPAKPGAMRVFVHYTGTKLVCGGWLAWFFNQNSPTPSGGLLFVHSVWGCGGEMQIVMTCVHLHLAS